MFNIAIWNANGLSQHKPEVVKFLHDHNIDIMLVSESHFTKKNFFFIRGYITYDTKHPKGKARGGTAIIIRRGILHHELRKHKYKHLMATSVSVQCSSGPITISAIYCPPRFALKEEAFDKFFASLGSKFLVGGDFNAKNPSWGSRCTNPKGRALLKSTNKNNLHVLSTGEPTYWPSDPNKTPDLIDFAVVKNMNLNCMTIKSCFELSSDHSPLLATIGEKPVDVKIQNFKLTNCRTNWKIYKKFLEDKMELKVPLKTNDDIEKAVDLFTNLLKDAARAATPEISLSSNKVQYISSDEVNHLIAEKRAARVWFKETRSPGAKKYWNHMIKVVKDALKHENANNLQKFVSELSPRADGGYSLWKVLKGVKRPKAAEPPIRKSKKSKWARSDAEKAQAFADHLSKVFTPYAADDSSSNPVLTAAPAPPAIPWKNIRVSQVKRVIKKEIKAKKSPGHDQIDGNMLKNMPENCVRFFTCLCNAIMRLGHFPSSWKLSTIVMIPKPGKDNTNVASYRPISLLSALSKLCEKLILKKMHPILERCNIIPDHQFGCRAGYSTVEQVHRVVSEVQGALEEKKYCSAVFLDVAQAFDKVWHEGLLEKIKHWLPQHYHKFMQSYLSGRKFRVKHRTALSSVRDINSGVPQGSVLGPVLYQIYTADLPKSDQVSMATFVDDTALLSTHVNPNTASRELQDYLNDLQVWLRDWRIKVNEGKSAHVSFTLKKRICPAVSLNGVKIPRENHVRYLGLHLDKKLNWKHHIDCKVKHLRLQYNKLKWLFGRKSKLPLESKVLLYKTVIRPIWTYGIQLWGTTSNSNLSVLQSFQSRVLRSMAGAPWYIRDVAIHRDLGISMVRQEIEKCSLRYKKRVRHHTSSLAKVLFNKTIYRRLKRTDPKNLSNRWTRGS